MSSEEMITLAASGKREKVEEAGAQAIIDAWKDQLAAAPANATVHKVVLSCKAYTTPAAKMISTYLKPLVSEVTIVDVSDVIASLMEEEGLEVLKLLCDTFADCSLVEVNLSDNAMGSKGINACESVLANQTKSLERLYLENMGLAAETTSLIADILTTKEDGTCACDHLRLLRFFDNMSGDDGAVAFKRILMACSKLEDLRYSGCRALVDGSRAIAEGLDEMGDHIACLTRLDLNGSNFGTGQDEDHGVASLGRALGRAKSLAYANLGDCGFGPEGTKLVSQELQQANAPLVELDISENEVGMDEAEPLADLLVNVVDTLKVFVCKDNELTSKGVKHLAKGLSSEHSVLQKLQLDLNECGHIGAKALCGAVLPSLGSLSLDENAFPADDLKQLEKAFGDKLVEMEENDEDADVDDDNDLEDEEEGAEEQQDEQVEELAQQMAQSHI